jgi:hypothetical protein
MDWIARGADWIMIASGILTATMVQAAIAPRAAMISLFGEALEGPLADLVVRNWGILITLVGLALVYGGWTGTSQVPILLGAGASKIAFIALVLAHGRRYLRRQAGIAIGVDAVFVVLYAAILAGRI